MQQIGIQVIRNKPLPLEPDQPILDQIEALTKEIPPGSRMVELICPDAVECKFFDVDGISFRAIRAFAYSLGQMVCRVDVLYESEKEATDG